MNEQLVDEPKNTIGQTPADQCYDAFAEALNEHGVAIHDEESEAIYAGIKSAIRMWEILKQYPPLDEQPAVRDD